MSVNNITCTIIYNVINNKFDITGNAKHPEKLIQAFLHTQYGKGEDKTPRKDKDVYKIKITLNTSEDIFTVSHDCGNKGLREGILLHFLNEND